MTLATLPAETKTVGTEYLLEAVGPPPAVTSTTLVVPFEQIVHLVSMRGLRRPRSPFPTGEQLKLIAAKNPPPAEWFDGEDECPFVPAD